MPWFCLAGEAVFARCLSSLKEERELASKSLTGPQGAKFTGDKTQFLEDIRKVREAEWAQEHEHRLLLQQSVMSKKDTLLINYNVIIHQINLGSHYIILNAKNKLKLYPFN